MQWNSQRNAGFSNGSPWLPVEPAFRRYNVAAEKGRPDSIYSWYAQLLKLRRDDAAFRDGAYVPLESGNRQVFAFGRKAASGELALIVLNTSAKPQKVRITGLPSAPQNLSKVLMASPPAKAPESESFTVAPYGVLIAASQ